MILHRSFKDSPGILNKDFFFFGGGEHEANQPLTHMAEKCENLLENINSP